MARVVTVFGLSGVGKSWMISRYAAAANIAHIQASQLMRDARAALVGGPVTSEDLRRGPVRDKERRDFRELRYPAAPSAAKPITAIAQVDGSGAGPAPTGARETKSIETEEPSNR
jgi:hypothetical protein